MDIQNNIHLPLSPVGEEEDFDVPHILRAKRDGSELTPKQIKYFVDAVCEDSGCSMEDAQLGAFLMAVFLKGMTKEETFNLTKAMKESGKDFQWPSSWTVVDKHSTGGVGDKVSLVLAPALAAKGLKVPMISGRGLEHTGGTLDKLESIPGFQVYLSQKMMMSALENVGCCIVGQTSSLVPADKRMYAIRDVTSTVKSLPLIVSSIISKKACESLHSLVLDVKYGSGSFNETQFEAEKLAESLVDIGEEMGIRTSALVTRMDHPIGRKIGNALEVEEALQCLRGEGPEDLTELVASLGAVLLESTNRASSFEDGKSQIIKTLKEGTALVIFAKMIEAQGVSKNIAERLCGPEKDYSCLPVAKHSTKILSQESGIIGSIHALKVAKVCLSIGAGRMKSLEPINYAVGVVLLKVEGERVEAGEAWAEIRHDDILEPYVLKRMQSAMTLRSDQVPKDPQPLVARCIESKS